MNRVTYTRVLGVALGLLLQFSGIAKSREIEQFSLDIAGLLAIPLAPAATTAGVVVAVELATALMLILGHHRRFVFCVTAVMFSIFALSQVGFMFRGIEGCRCFGSLLSGVPRSAFLAFNVVVAAAAFVLFRQESQSNSQ